MEETQFSLLLNEINNNALKIWQFIGKNTLNSAQVIQLCENTSLRFKELKLHNSSLSHESVKALSVALEKNTSLTSLSLEDSQIDDTSVQYLISALKVNTSITSLNLAHNQLSSKSMEAIRDLLKYNQHLKHLDLGFNKGIGNEGITYLAEGLANNKFLMSLDLSCTNLDDKSISPLSKALIINSTLSSLALAGNKITAQGGELLIKTLYKNLNLTLTNINLKNNDSKEKVIKSLKTTHKLNILKNIFFNIALVFIQGSRQNIFPTDVFSRLFLEVSRAIESEDKNSSSSLLAPNAFAFFKLYKNVDKIKSSLLMPAQSSFTPNGPFQT